MFSHFEFSYAATEKSFQQVFRTLKSFSNSTMSYTDHIHMFISADMNISMSVSSKLLLFCGVGYFKGLKHSIFKSCHQIPMTSVLVTWRVNFLPYAVYLRMSNTFLRILSSLVGQKHKQVKHKNPSMWNVSPTSFIPSPRTPELGIGLEFGFLSLWC